VLRSQAASFCLVKIQPRRGVAPRASDKPLGSTIIRRYDGGVTTRQSGSGVPKMGRKKKATLRIEGTLELEPDCLKYLDEVTPESLEGWIFEIKTISLPLKFEHLVGTISFVAPDPRELKKARLEYLQS
jgi:hypothetical protein